MVFSCTSALVTLADLSNEVLVDFYRRLLVRDPQPYIPQVYAEFQLPGLRLGIFQPKLSHRSEFAGSATAGMSLCLEVEDLEIAIAHLVALGYPPEGDIQVASHGLEIYAYDPSGNRLILHQSHSKDREESRCLSE